MTLSPAFTTTSNGQVGIRQAVRNIILGLAAG